MPLRPEFTLRALDDVATIQDWTAAKFGELTSQRYDALMEAALADLLASPDRLGVSQHPALPADVSVYHLRFSRKKAARPAVEKPRHFFVFRIDDDVLTVLRVLHDSIDLPSHIDSDESSQ